MPGDFFTPPWTISQQDQAAAAQQQEMRKKQIDNQSNAEPALLRHTHREHVMHVNHDDHFTRLPGKNHAVDVSGNFRDVWPSFDTRKKQGKRGRK